MVKKAKSYRDTVAVPMIDYQNSFFVSREIARQREAGKEPRVVFVDVESKMDSVGKEVFSQMQ